MKDYEKCIAECEQAVDVGRDNRADYKVVAKAYARIAKAHQLNGNLKEAVRFYDKALANHRAPDFLALKKKAEKLVKEQERQAYIDPEKALEAKERGNEHFKEGRFPEAVKEYTEAIKRSPDDGKMYRCVGFDVKGGVEDFTRGGWGWGGRRLVFLRGPFIYIYILSLSLPPPMSV